MLDPRNALSPAHFSGMLADAEWYLAMPDADFTAIMARGDQEYVVVPAVPRVIAERILADHRREGHSAFSSPDVRCVNLPLFPAPELLDAWFGNLRDFEGFTRDDAKALYRALLDALDERECHRARTSEHVCGLAGYNGMIDPPCPACESNREGGERG